MIFFSKKFCCIEVICTMCLLAILGILLWVSPEQGYWIANVIHDKTFLFIYLPFFLIAIYIIDYSMLNAHVTRFKNRKELILFSLIQQYMHILIFVTILWLIIILLTVLKFQSIINISMKEMLMWYVKYMMQFSMINNVIMIIRRSNIRRLQEAAYVAVYCIVVLENVLVVEWNAIFARNIYLCFSWIYSKNMVSFIIMCVWNILFGVVLLQKSSQKDIF